MQYKTFLLFATFCWAVPAQPQSDQVGFSPPPPWAVQSEPLPVPDAPGGAIFIRKQDTLVNLDQGGQSTFIAQNFRILRPEGLKLGNISLEWDPASGQPTVHGVRIHRNGQVIDVLENASFEILRREDQLEEAMLNGRLTAVLRVPDLRVGDDLEFIATTLQRELTFPDRSFGLLMLGPQPPPGRFKLGLSWTDGRKPTMRIPETFGQGAQVTENSFAITFDNPAPLEEPRDAPFRFAWTRIFEFSHFSSWQDVSKQASGLFTQASQIDPQSALGGEIKAIAAAHSRPEARMRAALELVQNQVRYVYVGLEGGNFRPASADETWERRYGDCKGKTALLLALLEGLGIQAEAVLVNNGGTDDGLNDRLPNPAMFDHVLVRARIGARTHWLDGTLPSGFGPAQDPVIPYRWVLPLSAAGTALEERKPVPPAMPLEMGLFEIDASNGFDQPARITNRSVLRGVNAVMQYQQLGILTPAQLTAAFRNSLASDPTWDDIESVEYRFEPATQAGILTIAGTGRPDWEPVGDGAYSMALPGGGFSPPPRRQRPTGQDQTAPYYSQPNFSCHVTTVRLPAATRPESWSLSSWYDTMLFGRTYFRAMELTKDGIVRMVRGSRVEEAEITPQNAARDNDRIARFDNSKAVITYRPDEAEPLVGGTARIPAVFEHDWIADPSPCLPPDLAKR